MSRKVTEKSPLRRYAWIGILVALVFFAPSQNLSLSFLQRMYFGKIRAVCLAGVGIEFGDPWLIDVLDKGENERPLIFGLIPVPRGFTALSGKSPQLLLRSSKDGGVASFHVGQITVSKEKLLSDCKLSSVCQPIGLDKQDIVDAIKVVAGDTTWITLTTLPVMVALRGATPEQLKEIKLQNCN